MTAVAAPPAPAARHAAHADRGGQAATHRLDRHHRAGETLRHSAAFALRVLEHAERRHAQALGGTLLPDIDLPPVAAGPEDQAHLQVAGPLYLAADVEQAGLLHAAETAAGLFASGGRPGDVGAAGALLERFWQTRSQRFAAAERMALYARLFDEWSGATLSVPGAVNDEFGTLMIDLCEAVARAADGSSLSQGPVRTAAESLAENLLPRVGGIAAFAARELLGTVHQAIAILEVPALQRTFAAHSLWEAVHAIVESEQPGAVAESSVEHVNRGSAGLTVLTWLAGVLPALGAATGALIGAQSPVLEAATAWLQASLAIAEAHTAPQRTG
jgi:hypothetical protein